MAVREGQRLGRFTLVRQLGKGGGGEAWEAALVGPYGFTRRKASIEEPQGKRPVQADPVSLCSLSCFPVTKAGIPYFQWKEI